MASSTGCPQCGHAKARSDTSLPHSVQNLSATHFSVNIDGQGSWTLLTCQPPHERVAKCVTFRRPEPSWALVRNEPYDALWLYAYRNQVSPFVEAAEPA